MKKAIIAGALMALALSADTMADGIWNPVATSGAVWGDGPNNAQGMGGGSAGGCTGAANFSDGCAIAVFGH